MGQYDFLLGAQPPQMQDPLRMAMTGMSLALMADSSAQRKLAIQTAQQQQEALQAANRVLPGVTAAGFSPESVQAAIQQEPASASLLLDMLDKKQKSQADIGLSNAHAAEFNASAKTKLLAPITNQAFQLANKPNLSADDIKQLMGNIASNGLEHLVPTIPMQQWTDPNGARAALKTIGASFFDAEKQVSTQETGRHNVATEGLTASAQAETGRHNKAEEGIGYGNLGVAQGGLALRKQAADPFGMLGINPNPPKSGAAQTLGSDVHGDAFLKSMPPQLADQVKALAEGRMQFPGSFALKTPYWQNMLSAVAQYDPSFDAVNYNARAATRKDFTSGKSAQSLNALNTVAGHLATLADAAKSLDNFGGAATPLNAPVNAIQNALGDPRVGQFNVARKTVADEMVRAYRAAGGSERDIQEWMTLLNANGSPQQQAANLAQVSELLSSKINALGEQYKQGMGTTSQPIQLVTPKAQAVFDRLEGGKPGAKPSGGYSVTAPNGKTYTFDTESQLLEFKNKAGL